MEEEERKDSTSDRKVRIADAANTYDYALAAIYDKGYGVFLYPHPYDEENNGTGRFRKVVSSLHLIL
jgi:hypothetical protein